ncbi:hypothetical protein LXA43DRAFT_1062919 [Ganoderma leucocontextum]|nr:hypothetical protein LXA43DRAFT_1062919 [Ganoderma leucocontextum]
MPFHFQLNAMNNDPGSLENHRTLLYHAKLDLKKPEYNKAKELLYHFLIAHIIDCTWYYIPYHFIGLSIWDTNIDRIWLIYDFWAFMMRGAGCHNYRNEILEMKASNFHRRYAEVSATGDIKVLLSDLKLQWVHEFTSDWRVPPPPI